MHPAVSIGAFESNGIDGVFMVFEVVENETAALTSGNSTGGMS